MTVASCHPASAGRVCIYRENKFIYPRGKIRAPSESRSHGLHFALRERRPERPEIGGARRGGFQMESDRIKPIFRDRRAETGFARPFLDRRQHLPWVRRRAGNGGMRRRIKAIKAKPALFWRWRQVGRRRGVDHGESESIKAIKVKMAEVVGRAWASAVVRVMRDQGQSNRIKAIKVKWAGLFRRPAVAGA
jgi:hypothetical protein